MYACVNVCIVRNQIALRLKLDDLHIYISFFSFPHLKISCPFLLPFFFCYCFFTAVVDMFVHNSRLASFPRSSRSVFVAQLLRMVTKWFETHASSRSLSSSHRPSSLSTVHLYYKIVQPPLLFLYGFSFSSSLPHLLGIILSSVDSQNSVIDAAACDNEILVTEPSASSCLFADICFDSASLGIVNFKTM